MTKAENEGTLNAAIIENAADGIALATTEGVIVRGNRAWYEVLGYDYDASEMEGMSLEKLWPEDELPVLGEEALPKALKGTWRGEQTHLKKDGTPFTASISLFALKGADGEVSHVAKIIRDVTVQKEAMDRVATFQNVIEFATDGIAIVNLDKTISYGKRAWYDMLGHEFDGQEMEDMALDVLWLDDEVDILHKEAVPQALDGGWRGEAKHVRKDGSSFDTAITLYPLRNDDGEIVAVAKIIRDVTEQKEAEATIREQNEAIMEMSTPVIRLWRKVILMPLIGVVDTKRTQMMIDSLLHAIVNSESTVAILDVTGVPVIDTSVARHLLRAIDSARILGAEVVVTGFSPEAAQTLAQLGVDLSSMRTAGSLLRGVQEAIEMVGDEIVRAG